MKVLHSPDDSAGDAVDVRVNAQDARHGVIQGRPHRHRPPGTVSATDALKPLTAHGVLELVGPFVTIFRERDRQASCPCGYADVGRPPLLRPRHRVICAIVSVNSGTTPLNTTAADGEPVAPCRECGEVVVVKRSSHLVR